MTDRQRVSLTVVVLIAMMIGILLGQVAGAINNRGDWRCAFVPCTTSQPPTPQRRAPDLP